MKYELFNPPVRGSDTVHLRLVKVFGGVALAVVDAEGIVVEGGYVCILNLEGDLTLPSGVISKYGFKLQDGHIRIRN